MKIADEGSGSPSGKTKPVIFFEGQSNHRIPIHNQSLSFKALAAVLVMVCQPFMVSPQLSNIAGSTQKYIDYVQDIDFGQLIVEHYCLEYFVFFVSNNKTDGLVLMLLMQLAANLTYLSVPVGNVLICPFYF